MRKLHLDKLKEGLPGISPAYGAFLAEAATVCLVIMGHRSGVQLSVTGDFEEKFRVEWAQEIGAEEQSSWQDLKEAAEYGATAIALLISMFLLDFDFYERVPQHLTGDYVLKKTDSSEKSAVGNTALLEISGILQEAKTNQMETRIQLKESRFRKNKMQNLPGFIVVVEFGRPKAKIIQG